MPNETIGPELLFVFREIWLDQIRSFEARLVQTFRNIPATVAKVETQQYWIEVQSAEILDDLGGSDTAKTGDVVSAKHGRSGHVVNRWAWRHGQIHGNRPCDLICLLSMP